MNKYDFALDMETDNSCSLILREIKNKSSVLEMGPAHGRMTKYLKEELNCYVCIVEKDVESGTSAQQWANRAFLGDEGDINDSYWPEQLKQYRFDHIIFADVLEHLYDPWGALARAAGILRDGGTILISVPNIAHNSVIIDLMHDKFNYRQVGLLDSTHIRFFTDSTLRNMVENVGCYVSKEMNTHCAVEHTEFENSFDLVPSDVEDFLRNREFGDVYQFVWELKKNGS